MRGCRQQLTKPRYDLSILAGELAEAALGGRDNGTDNRGGEINWACGLCNADDSPAHPNDPDNPDMPPPRPYLGCCSD